MGKRSTAEALAYFDTVPRTKVWTQNSSYEALEWANPTNGGPGTTNGFYMKTLNTNSTIPHVLALVRKDLPIPPGLPSDDAGIHQRRTPSVQNYPPDLVFMMRLGHGGLDGHGGMMHGGMVSALLDHCSGHAVAAHQQDPQRTATTLQLYTVHMTTSFFGPVRTDGREIIIQSWLVVKTSSKWVTRAQIVSENGIVLAQGDSLWIVARPRM